MEAVARPTLLTDQVREELEETLAAGTPVRIAAARMGISKSTLHSWIQRGLIDRRPRLRLVEDELPDEEDDLAEEDARIEAALVGAVMKAAREDWRAARWLLRNRWPGRWARA